MFQYQDQQIDCFCFDASKRQHQSGLKSHQTYKFRFQSNSEERKITQNNQKKSQHSKISLKRKKPKTVSLSKVNQSIKYSTQHFMKPPQFDQKNITQTNFHHHNSYQPPQNTSHQNLSHPTQNSIEPIRPMTQIRNYYNMRFNYQPNPVQIQIIEPERNCHKINSARNFSFKKSKVSLNSIQNNEDKRCIPNFQTLQLLHDTLNSKNEIMKMPVETQYRRKLQLKEIESIVDENDQRSDVMSEVIGRGWQGIESDIIFKSEAKNNLKTETIVTKASNVKNSSSMNSNVGESLMRWA